MLHPRHSTFCILHSALCVLLLAGCMVGPDYKRPSDTAADSSATFLPGTLPPSSATNETTAWWAAFDDPILLGLLGTARTNNLTVRQAVQRLRQSRASLAASKAELWPEVGFSAGVTKSKTYKPDDSATRVSAGFDASWEIDLFGGIRRGVEAARAELAVAELTVVDARISLYAELAGEYVNLRLLQTQYGIAVTNLAVQRSFCDIAKAKFDAGMAAERDKIASEAQWRSLEARLPSLRVSISAAIRRIELLAGTAPGAFDDLLSPAAPIPVAPALPSAVPSDLLRRRPDVRRAEAAYAAALARVGVAIANYYPSVSIGAGASLSSDSLSDWSDAMKTLSVGPSARWSILAFGRNKARADQAKAAAEESALGYREAVLGAVHEVENGWKALQEERLRAAPLAASAALQQRNLDLSEDLYRKDLGEYQEVLSSQQALLSARESSAAQLANCTLDAIALFKALGGGWDGEM